MWNKLQFGNPDVAAATDRLYRCSTHSALFLIRTRTLIKWKKTNKQTKKEEGKIRLQNSEDA